MKFCGQNSCKIDANGRVKLAARFLRDFSDTSGTLVLHCLPEGALGLYPPDTWAQMRQDEPRPAARAASSVVFRRQLRRFGALSQVETLSKQGRVTIPPQFRQVLGLAAGADAVMVGVEIGLEIWPEVKWQQEFETLHAHELEKAEAEMKADIEINQGGQRNGN
ncbi:MAG: hypothetical protein R6V56_05125 [Lentisphaeria bacterium]